MKSSSVSISIDTAKSAICLIMEELIKRKSPNVNLQSLYNQSLSILFSIIYRLFLNDSFKHSIQNEILSDILGDKILDQNILDDITAFIISQPLAETQLPFGSQYETLLQFAPVIDQNNNIELIPAAHRKSTGSFYTPLYIVDYIVKKTLTPLLENASAKVSKLRDVSLIDALEPYLSLRILDPSAGVGYFLLSAADFIAGWITRDPNIPHLSLSLKDLRYYYRNLVVENSIFAIDIDPFAIKLLKLSLSLNIEITPEMVSAFDKHIICANALMLNDIKQITDFSCGFDAVISNPPYLFGENIPQDVRDISKEYEFASGQYDVYWLFYEASIKLYLKSGAFHGYIVPDPILARDETKLIRYELTKSHRLVHIAHVGCVFDSPAVSAAIIIWQKDGCQNDSFRFASIDINTIKDTAEVNQQDILSIPGCKWLAGLESEGIELISRVYMHSINLGDIVKISRGEEIGKELLNNDLTSVPMLTGADITSLGKSNASFGVKKEHIRKNPDIYKSPKIVFVKTGAKVVATIDYENHVTMQSVYNLHQKDKHYSLAYICALIRSNLVNYIAQKTFTDYKRLFPQFNQSTVLSLPVKKIDFITPENERKKLVDELIQLVPDTKSVLVSISNLLKTGSPKEDVVHDLLSYFAEMCIKSCADNSRYYYLIDQIVYLLYGLTKDEIAVIERK